MADSLSSVELSQKELGFLLALLQMAVETGKLKLGDVISLAPLLLKIDSKILRSPEKVEEGKVVNTPKN